MRVLQQMSIGAMVLISSLVWACSPAPAQDVHSYLQGTVTVSSEIDSTADYEGFEVIVAQSAGGAIDTLGYATTDRQGEFATDVTAPGRGVYALLIMRRGEVLNTSEIAVAEGDSAVLRAELPLNGRPPRIRSQENAAWAAYKNTEAQHSQGLVQLLKEGSSDEASIGMAVQRTAGLLWSLRETFPGTIGANVAAVKSVTMLETWDDSLVVDRSNLLNPEVPGYIEAVRAAHRAKARIDGLEASVQFLRDIEAQTDDRDLLAALEATVVQARLDSLQTDRAIEAAQALQQEFPDTIWEVWAQRVEYEARNLMPGMTAPAIEAVTRSGGDFSLAGLRGKIVVLEFFDPFDANFRQQVPQAKVLADDLGEGLAWVSVALNEDPDLIEGFYEGREMPGIGLQDTRAYGSDLARAYNVNSLPTRYLIDEEGRIVKKYLGDSLLSVASDLRTRLGQESSP